MDTTIKARESTKEAQRAMAIIESGKIGVLVGQPISSPSTQNSEEPYFCGSRWPTVKFQLPLPVRIEVMLEP
jgi:hypothetical protein